MRAAFSRHRIVVVMAVCLLATACGVTTRVSIPSEAGDPEGIGYGGLFVGSQALSADGQRVAYAGYVFSNSAAIEVRDRTSGTTSNADRPTVFEYLDDDRLAPSMSADGRWLAYEGEDLKNLGGQSLAVQDLQTATVTEIENDELGYPGPFRYPSISGDGHYVAYVDWDPALPDARYVVRRDLTTGAKVTASVDLSGSNADGEFPSISADGQRVAFLSKAANLVIGDTNAKRDVFVRDFSAGTTQRVSLSTTGQQANLASVAPVPPSISANGQRVAFASIANNLVPGDTNSASDIFVRDILSGSTLLISQAGGSLANGPSTDPAINADGTRIAFSSTASNLVSGDTNGVSDVFRADLKFNSMIRASVSTSNEQGDRASTRPSINGDGLVVAFTSSASNLAGDGQGYGVFVNDTRQQAGAAQAIGG